MYLLSIHCRLPYWGVNTSRESIESYLDWLLYLRQESEFTVQDPLPNAKGDLVTEVPIGVADEEPLFAILHRWLDGEDLPDGGKDHLERSDRSSISTSAPSRRVLQNLTLHPR